MAAYARVSSSSEDQLNSFAAQNAHYTELITANPEWEFVDVYADKGITGTSAERAGGLPAAAGGLPPGPGGQDPGEVLLPVRPERQGVPGGHPELKALGVGVCFEEQGIDTSELVGEFLTAIFAMMDQKESENISDNIRWSIQKRDGKRYIRPLFPSLRLQKG